MFSAGRFIGLVLLLSGLGLHGVEVKVSGRGAGEPGKAREQALAQALREAVRQGAGVDIVSETKVENFELQSDQVMTSSFGYIENYEIVSHSYDEGTQTYTVTIKAEVKKGRPQMDQVLELRMLVKRMQSPRVMVEAKEKIAGEGMSDDGGLCTALLEEIAQNTGFELFKKSALRERDEREGDRAALLGEELESKVKKLGIQSTSDFKITAGVRGQVGRMREPFPDVHVRDVSLGVDLQAVWTDTGEVIATVSLPTTFHKGEAKMDLPFDMPEQLVRHYLLSMLTGKEKAFKDNNAYALFRKIIAKWITELDLGAKVQLEFRKIDKQTLDKLVSALKETEGISYVWRREFDSRLYSSLELETRLDAGQLEDVVLKALKGKYVIDSATKRRLRFIPQGK